MVLFQLLVEQTTVKSVSPATTGQHKRWVNHLTSDICFSTYFLLKVIGLGEQTIFVLYFGSQHSMYLFWFLFPYFCRLVKELGSRNIVQIACGDQHAMALCRGSLFQEHFSSKQRSCLLWEGSVCAAWSSWWYHYRVMSSWGYKVHWLSMLLLPPSTQGSASLSVSLQFLSTAPLQRCVVESRCGCPTLQSPDLLILKLQHVSGRELLASMTLGAFILAVLSHMATWDCPKEVRRKQIWPHMIVLPWS